MENDGQALLKPDALLDNGTHAINSDAHARLHRSYYYGNGGPLNLQLRSQCGENGTTAARTGAPMAHEPKRVSSHEKHGKPQECHERPLHHRHTTARACIGLRSPTRGGEHDSGSTLLPLHGLVGPSVCEATRLCMLAPSALPSMWALAALQ